MTFVVTGFEFQTMSEKFNQKYPKMQPKNASNFL